MLIMKNMHLINMHFWTSLTETRMLLIAVSFVNQRLYSHLVHEHDDRVRFFFPPSTNINV